MHTQTYTHVHTQLSDATHLNVRDERRVRRDVGEQPRDVAVIWTLFHFDAPALLIFHTERVCAGGVEPTSLSSLPVHRVLVTRLVKIFLKHNRSQDQEEKQTLQLQFKILSPTRATQVAVSPVSPC